MPGLGGSGGRSGPRRALQKGERVRLLPLSELWTRHDDLRPRVGTIVAVALNHRHEPILTVEFEGPERLVGVAADNFVRA